MSQELLAIKAPEETVAALVYTATSERPIISEFLDTLGPDKAFVAVHFFLGSLIAQQPGLLEEAKGLLDASIQLANVLKSQYEKENPDAANYDGFRLIWPAEMVSAVSIPDATGDSRGNV